MDRKAFFDHCRTGIMGPVLDGDEVTGSGAVLDAMAGAPLAYTAYALATAWHETAHTMRPIKEYGGTAYYTRLYDITGQRPALAKANGNIYPGDGPLFCGRGYVQLTWRNNYKRFGELTGYPLEGNPDLAMRSDIAAQIMRVGMEHGLFTGRAFDSFLPKSGPANQKQFTDARRIINGSDKAPLIAGYALQFQDALTAGGWQ